MIPPPPHDIQRRAWEAAYVLRHEFGDRLTLEQHVRAEVILRMWPLGWDECGWAFCAHSLVVAVRV